MKNLILILILLFVLTLSIFAEEISVTSNKNMTINSIKKQGYEIYIPKNTFNKNVILNLTIPKNEEISKYNTKTFSVDKPPISIGVKGEEFVNFHNPIKITYKFDDKYKDKPETLFFGYYDNGKWLPYIPDSIDLDKKTITYSINHFSSWGFGTPSQDEQIDAYSNTVAKESWTKELNKKEFMATNSKHIDSMLLSMGVKDSKARNQLMSDMVSFIEPDSTKGILDYATQSTNDFNNKSADSYKNRLLKFTGEGLLYAFKKNSKFMTLPANVLGSLSTAAGCCTEGDYDGAMESISQLMKDSHPAVELGNALVEFSRKKAGDLTNYIAKGELEDAYQLYIGKGVEHRGLDTLEGDIDGCCDYLGIGGGLANEKMLNNYCDRFNKDPNKLSSSERNELINKARTDLESYFKKRKAAETYIKKQKAIEKEFIMALKDEFLLSSTSYNKFFKVNSREFNMNDRLNRLYNIKVSVLSMMDPEVARKIEPKFLAKAMGEYISCVERGDRDAFFDYLIKMKYVKVIKKPVKPVPKPTPKPVVKPKPIVKKEEKPFIVPKMKEGRWVLYEMRGGNSPDIPVTGRSEKEYSYGKVICTWTPGKYTSNFTSYTATNPNSNVSVTTSAFPKVLKPYEEFTIHVTMNSSHISGDELIIIAGSNSFSYSNKSAPANYSGDFKTKAPGSPSSSNMKERIYFSVELSTYLSHYLMTIYYYKWEE